MKKIIARLTSKAEWLIYIFLYFFIIGFAVYLTLEGEHLSF